MAPSKNGRRGLKVEREVRIEAPRQAVWDFLWDVPRLAACIPGAKEVRTVEEGRRYAAVVGEKVGPFKVQFPLEIEVLEVQAPERLRARAGGRDAAVDGLVKVDLEVALTAAGDGTTLKLAADISVLGKLGTLGHSVIVRKGTDIVDRFAAAVRAQLESEGKR
ncbi:MAG TPA: SRPBCC domain-containing protein [Methylomirabilota bacterium]|nr:SRPBCC domain-containing protein [Methylomirabilota bacterium]